MIEDEAALRAILQEMLVAQGYRVQACGSVAEARAVLTAQQPAFDLILSDSALPDGRGLNLVLEAKAADPGLGAVLMTGYPDDRGELDRIREAGLVLLQKPVPRAELMVRIDAVLKARRHR